MSTIQPYAVLLSAPLLGLGLFGANAEPPQEPGDQPATAAEKSHVQSAGAVKEPETGISFPIEIKLPDSASAAQDASMPMPTSMLVLGGVGVHEKSVLGTDVYAVGFYVDAPAASQKLSRWMDADEVADKDAFYKALDRGGFSRAIRIAFAKNVEGEGFRNNLLDELSSRLESRPETEKAVRQSAQHAALEKLRMFLDRKNFEEESELTIYCLSGNQVVVALNGRELGRMNSQELCQTLPALYLGEDPIDNTMRQDVANRLPKTLKKRGTSTSAPERGSIGF